MEKRCTDESHGEKKTLGLWESRKKRELKGERRKTRGVGFGWKSLTPAHNFINSHLKLNGGGKDGRNASKTHGKKS